ncbi:MAG: HAMP domain-containing histidine kinase [Burkholderiaceae bacterium]|nr:MAG: HAMP domain-containing histidine kinase [Burkholderiaceae bacterium]
MNTDVQGQNQKPVPQRSTLTLDPQDADFTAIEAGGSDELRARTVKKRMYSQYASVVRPSQILSAACIPVFAYLCRNSDYKRALLLWVVMGVLLTGIRGMLVLNYRMKFAGKDLGMSAQRNALRPQWIVTVAIAAFWGSSVFFFLDDLGLKVQMACWFILVLVVSVPIPAIALIARLSRYAVNAFFLTLLSIILYCALTPRPESNQIIWWTLAFPALYWALLTYFSKNIHQNQKSHLIQEYNLSVQGDRALGTALAKTRILTAAAHDMRLPVLALSQYAYWLADSDNPQDRAELVSKIVTASKAANHLCDSLFDLSSMDCGDVRLKIDLVELSCVAQDLIVQYAPLAAAKDIELRLHVVEKTVMTDPARIGRMLGNVLSNAIKYSPRGKKILVAIRPHQDGACVEVWDQGIGIAPQDINQVFLEFYRVPEAKEYSADGIGLGLALVARLARALKVKLVLSSQLGKGTRFSMLIPNLH